MKNRIILMKADFSQNNIGRYIAVDELTKKVLAKQTQYSESSDECSALNDFIVALKDEGFLGGENPILKTLVIPALANSHDELLYDIARTDVNGYPINIMPEAEKTADVKSFFPYEENGRVIGIVRDCTEGRITMTDSNNQSRIQTNMFTNIGEPYPPFSAMVYKRGSLYKTDTLISTSNLNYKVILSSSQAKIEWINQPTNAHIKAPISPIAEKGIYIVNYNDTKFNGIINGTSIGETEVLSPNTLIIQDNSSLIELGTYAYGEQRWFNASIIAIGNAMTEHQISKFAELVETLMVKLHANIK